MRNDGNSSDYLGGGGLLSRKAKSFEERDEQYEHPKLRMYKKRGQLAVAAAGGEAMEPGATASRSGATASGGVVDAYWPSWGGSDGSEHEQPMRNSTNTSKNHRLLKVQSLVSVDESVRLCIQSEDQYDKSLHAIKVRGNQIGRTSANFQVAQFRRLWSSIGCP